MNTTTAGVGFHQRTSNKLIFRQIHTCTAAHDTEHPSPQTDEESGSIRGRSAKVSESICHTHNAAVVRPSVRPAEAVRRQRPGGSEAECEMSVAK